MEKKKKKKSDKYRKPRKEKTKTKTKEKNRDKLVISSSFSLLVTSMSMMMMMMLSSLELKSQHLNNRMIFHLKFSFYFRMAHCYRANVTDEDLSLIRKIYMERTWAWWTNHIGKCSNEHFSFLIRFFRNVNHLYHRFLWKFIMSFDSLSTMFVIILFKRLFSLCFFILALIRNSYTQYLIALAIVDTGAILSESSLKNSLRSEEFHRLFSVSRSR